MSVKEVEWRRQMEDKIEETIKRRLIEVQEQERSEEIRKSRYNNKYEIIQTMWLPKYLKNSWK